MDIKESEEFYGPIFVLGPLKFVWFAENLLGGTPEEAKKIGQDLEAGYTSNKIPIKAAQRVAKFKSDGQYVMVELGPEGNSRPAIAINPGDADSGDFDGGEEQQKAVLAEMDEVPEIPYDQIGDTTFVKSTKW